MSVQAEADVSVSFLTEEYTTYGCVWYGCPSVLAVKKENCMSELNKVRKLTVCLLETCLRFPLNRPSWKLFWAAMSNERTPLITSGVCGLTMTSAVCGTESNATSDSSHGTPSKDPRQLNTFFGVMVPTILSMFSIILFLRTGEWRHNVRPLQTLDVLLWPKLMRFLSSRVCGWSCRTVARFVDAGCSLHHYISHNTLHLRYFHQWCYTRGRSLLYPDSCCPDAKISLFL